MISCDQILRLYEEGKLDWEPLPNGLHRTLIMVNNELYKEIKEFDERTVMKIINEIKMKGIKEEDIDIINQIEIQMKDKKGKLIDVNGNIFYNEYYKPINGKIEYMGISELECI